MNETDSGITGRLLEEFPPHSYDQWKDAAIALLKGASFEKRLISRTYEGFSLQPIYNASDVADLPHLRSSVPGLGNQVRASRLGGYRSRPWLISQELSAPTPEALNKLILSALNGGQNELNLWLDAPSRAGVEADQADEFECGMCGVSLAGVNDFLSMFEGVNMEMISAYIRAGAFPLSVAAGFFEAMRQKEVNLTRLEGCIECDPVGWLVTNGSHPAGMDAALDEMGALAKFVLDTAPSMRSVCVQGHGYHNGGASSVQELAAVISTGAYYLSALIDRGVCPNDAAGLFRLSISIGPNFFVEIAKVRALRMLWTRVLEAFGVDPEARRIHIHGRTGLWNKTVLDPYVNMLRTTTEAMSGVVGGLDSLCVGAFDEVVREPDDFSRRIARNTHHILAEECDLTKVIDPAGGSWAVEKLTDQLASETWKLFQELETKGGILAALESGWLQDEVASMLSQKRKAIGQRRDTLVGINNFPNPNERPLRDNRVHREGARSVRVKDLTSLRSSRDAAAVKATIGEFTSLGREDPKRVKTAMTALRFGATLAELAVAEKKEEKVTVQPILLSRASIEFESLAEQVRKLGHAGAIMQVNFGPSRRYRLRADWTSAFFRVCGFPVMADDDFMDIEAAVGAVGKSEARIAVITSDDETYGEQAPAIAKALRTAYPDLHILLAGTPGESEAAWREAGVDDFVHVRVNNLEFNRDLFRLLEAKK